MKKQNKTYIPLKKLGIYKAFDKCVVYSDSKDSKYYDIVLFYSNKPFVSWAVRSDNYDDAARDLAIDCCIKHYNGLDLNARRISKKVTKFCLERSKKNVVERF